MPDLDPDALNDSLRRLHRSAIVSLAICAVGIGVVALASRPQPPAESTDIFSLVALALAAVAILLRRSLVAPRSLRAFVYGSVISMLGAVGLGLLGLYVALHQSQALVGLLYTLAGVLLLLRPPATLGVDGGQDSGS
jgi:hypothetical protein